MLSSFGFNQNFNAGNRFQFNPQALNNQADALVNNLTQGGQSLAEAAENRLPEVAQFARSNGADILGSLNRGAIDLRGRIEAFQGYPGRTNRNNRDVRVSQVTNDQGLPESQVRVRVPRGTQITNPDGFSVQSMIANPLDGSQNLTPMNITRSEVDGRFLNLFVDGPVSNGSQINIADGALTNRRGQPQGARDITLDNPRRFDSPQEAALWGKAYEPTNLDLFPSTIYNNTPAQGIPQSTDPAVVRQDLTNHFQKFVDAGEMRPGQMNRMLRLYDNDRYRQSFVDPTTGQFEPQLMAAVLSTAGTPGQGSIAAIIGGKNETGRPAQVMYADLPASQLAQAEVIKDDQGQDLWQIQVNSRARNEPFQVLSPLLAHEAVHQDNLIGQDEELIGKSIEVNTWKNQLLVNPDLASLGTPLSRFQNLQVMMHENSGASFPNGGFFQAPGVTDVVPGEDVLNPVSFEDFLRNNVYAGTQDIDTPGNRFLDNFLRQGTRGRERWQRGQGFNDNTVARLDNSRFFSPEQNFQILQALQLQPTTA